MDLDQLTSKPWRKPKLQRVVRPGRPAHIPEPKFERKYDAESGQVYSQTEISFSRRQYSNWIGEPRTPSLVRKSAPVAGKGARSLADMARNKLASQFHSLTAEHFVAVPWHLAEEVWKELLDRYIWRPYLVDLVHY